MKQFRCGEIVPDCDHTIEGESEDDILARIGDHAREAHGMDEVPPEIHDRVRSLIVEK